MDEYVTDITESVFDRIRVARIFVGSQSHACFAADENFLVRCEMDDNFFNYYLRRDRVCFGNNVNIMEVVMHRFSPKLFLRMMEMQNEYCTGIHAYRYPDNTLFAIYSRGAYHNPHRFALQGWISDDYLKQREFRRVSDDIFMYVENPSCALGEI